MNHTVNDAAALATSTVKSALESLATLRGQTNASGTALQQAQVAGLITNGEVTAALAQLLAFQATQETAEALEAETRRANVTPRGSPRRKPRARTTTAGLPASTPIATAATPSCLPSAKA